MSHLVTETSPILENVNCCLTVSFLFKTLLLDEKHNEGGLFPTHPLLIQILSLFFQSSAVKE